MRALHAFVLVALGTAIQGITNEDDSTDFATLPIVMTSSQPYIQSSQESNTGEKQSPTLVDLINYHKTQSKSVGSDSQADSRKNITKEKNIKLIKDATPSENDDIQLDDGSNKNLNSNALVLRNSIMIVLEDISKHYTNMLDQSSDFQSLINRFIQFIENVFIVSLFNPDYGKQAMNTGNVIIDDKNIDTIYDNSTNLVTNKPIEGGSVVFENGAFQLIEDSNIDDDSTNIVEMKSDITTPKYTAEKSIDYNDIPSTQSDNNVINLASNNVTLFVNGDKTHSVKTNIHVEGNTFQPVNDTSSVTTIEERGAMAEKYQPIKINKLRCNKPIEEENFNSVEKSFQPIFSDEIYSETANGWIVTSNNDDVAQFPNDDIKPCAYLQFLKLAYKNYDVELDDNDSDILNGYMNKPAPWMSYRHNAKRDLRQTINYDKKNIPLFGKYSDRMFLLKQRFYDTDFDYYRNQQILRFLRRSRAHLLALRRNIVNKIKPTDAPGPNSDLCKLMHK